MLKFTVFSANGLKWFTIKFCSSLVNTSVGSTFTSKSSFFMSSILLAKSVWLSASFFLWASSSLCKSATVPLSLVRKVVIETNLSSFNFISGSNSLYLPIFSCEFLNSSIVISLLLYFSAALLFSNFSSKSCIFFSKTFVFVSVPEITSVSISCWALSSFINFSAPSL